MHLNKFKLFFILGFILASCIKPFDPEIISGDVNKIVVSGVVTNQDGNQTVTISRSSSLVKPEENMVTGCTVTISDDQGHSFPMTDAGSGNYQVYIDPVYLVPGRSFKVEINTPDGNRIESDFDRISPGPSVDSVYYVRRDLPTTNPAKVVKGIQFYADLDGSSTDSHYYRYEAVETFEYHSDYPLEWYYDGKIHHITPPDHSMMVCWLTTTVRKIYILSTTNLSANKYQQIPLNFVDNRTSRLLYGYSLLVNQYALSEAAYKYWDLLLANSTEEGGLYERQPMATKGNLHNLTHPDQDVLGFFGASSLKSKRIFVRNVDNLELEYVSPCTTTSVSKWGLADMRYLGYPLYLMGDATGYYPVILNKPCVDCRVLSGKNVKPDFWPW
jgi:hypothetical protein